MTCGKCGKQNLADAQFCSQCGTALVVSELKPAEERTCYRHPKEITLLSCGRCDRPICTRCATIGPAGPRCPECSKQNISFRPMGLWNDVKLGLRGLSRLGVMGIWILVISISVILGIFRSCQAEREFRELPPEPPEIEQSEKTSRP